MPTETIVFMSLMGLAMIAQPFAYWLLPNKQKPAYENVDTYFKIFAWSMGYVFLVLVGMVAYAVIDHAF